MKSQDWNNPNVRVEPSGYLTVINMEKETNFKEKKANQKVEKKEENKEEQKV